MTIGSKFNRWTVLADAGRKGRRLLWHCRCECGTERTVYKENVVSGKSKGCGCINKGNWRHGYRKTRTYQVWSQMLGRCSREDAEMYYRYGGRGIKICERWHDFRNFLADMGDAPPGKQIDRIDNDGDYEPNNCRWSTPTEQCNNRSTNRVILLKGREQTIAEWARELGVSPSTIINRLRLKKINPQYWPDERICDTNRYPL